MPRIMSIWNRVEYPHYKKVQHIAMNTLCLIICTGLISMLFNHGARSLAGSRIVSQWTSEEISSTQL